MANRQQQAVSKPLLIILAIVAIVGAFMLYQNMTANNEVDEAPTDVPAVPDDVQPPVLPPDGPRPTTGGN